MIETFLAALLTQPAATAPGRYQVESAPASCVLRLQPSLPTLPDASAAVSAMTGFAFATPACPLGLDRVSLWRLDIESQTLSLVDEGGAALLSAQGAEQNWAGQTSTGVPLRLIRD